MPSYPKITDDNFYERINKIYKKYRIPKDNKTIDQFCKPRQFKLQYPQEFVSQFINPKTPYKGLLVYHRIGAGKTCSAIQIAEKWKKIRKVKVVLPASLKGNFRNELRSLCGGNNYLKPNERKKLAQYDPSDDEYKEIIAISDKRIDKYYDIYSYNKFIEYCQDGTMTLRNSLLIIDEIQNMVSEDGTFYVELKKIIDNASESVRIVLLSATPMFDKPNEIALTMNLLRLKEEIPVNKNFERQFLRKTVRNGKTYYSTKNIDRFQEYIKGYVSYYRGAPPYTFPEMNVRYVKCVMSNFQYSAYKAVLKNEGGTIKSSKKKDMNVDNLPNNFYLGTRFVSNVVFPNRRTDERGYNSFCGRDITKNLAKYSTKFDNIVTKLKRRGKSFIYSSFKELAGLKSLVRVLEELGYKNYVYYGVGKKRFAIWSGDEDHHVKEEIREVFNRDDNLYGDKLKIILGSPSIKEGVSLKAVQFVHVLEPYWNQSRLDQVIGRASRFCSHKDLPEDKRLVRVYIYVSVHPKEDTTVDEYIKKLSSSKNKIIKDFEKAIKEAAIDCKLNKRANVYEDEEDIQCLV
jgi:superfamily II DNA or RNA helicase